MSLDILARDEKLKGRFMLALQKAIVKKFDAGDWNEIGYLTGQHDYIVHHRRLLRSLGFGDDDYGSCVFEVLNHFWQYDESALFQVAEHEKIRPYLEKHHLDVLSDLGISDAHVPTVFQSPLSAGEVVRRALADSEKLLQSNGAVSAVDRLHTALHGYLRSVCADAQIPVADGASITALFKAVRTNHPSLQDLGPQANEITRVLTAFSTVIDSINTIRNHASIAHPNENLLSDDEASLGVNAVRTIFNYLVKKVG
ncbi:abortive infection family protein [Methylobacter sp. YRD-M1]|uniref:abortive infection family protein n=1 Tax=Methylobacter sp. YRD-M1 TaxID=2911520 RepID=UPI00227D483E|nr:abortive infection family protein [Methylobacter sp. YRD-M1]WAK02797.1 abortive infection family protein [Methylobacter sp. YRD-M1]